MTVTKRINPKFFINPIYILNLEITIYYFLSNSISFVKISKYKEFNHENNL
jgi:hypothetical protein